MKILGIDLGGTNVRAGLVENDTLIKVESLTLRKNGSKEDVLDDVYNLIGRFSGEDISGIGIGVPSVVDTENGIVYEVQNIPSWKEIYLRDLLVEKYKIPIYINNDANCFAAGEKYFGKAKNYKNVVGLITGTGLGAGLIINGKLYAGKNCGAGEFGMLPFKNKNFEYFCSGQFFINEYNMTGEELALRAGKGDWQALNVFAEYGSNLGEAIKAVMYAVDPEIIVLGGSVGKSFNWFKMKMYESINSFAYPKSVKNLKTEVSETENIAILGAAALYYDDIA
jgi:glucokinase